MAQGNDPGPPNIEELVSSALEMIDEGIEPPLEQLCQGRPELLEVVRGALQLAEHMPGLQRDAAGHDALRGTLLQERYLLQQRLGAGAMGVVYRAQDRELGRDVAIKILRAEALAPEDALARFEREVQALAAIRHPSVVTVFDRGQTLQGQPFLVMELLEGLPLNELLDQACERSGACLPNGTRWIGAWLKADRLPETSYVRLMTRWAAELASGLSAAHAQGVLHRDIKPSNVFVRRDGTVVLLDFGLAGGEFVSRMTRADSMLGTPAYMPPESLELGSSSAATGDVYGLATTLYHMLALRPPYEGTPSQIFAHMARHDPVPVGRLRSELPPDLGAIVECGLTRKPSERYGTATDLTQDLRAFLEHRAVSARPISGLQRLWRKVRRSPVARTVLVMAVLSVCAVGVRAWNTHSHLQRKMELEELWARMPPALTIWAPSHRQLMDQDRERVQALLNRACALEEQPLGAHLLRGYFRLDHGDSGGGLEDMAAVCASLDSPYASQWLERVRKTVAGHSLDAEDPRGPTEALDHYLCAFELLRHAQGAGDLKVARDLLTHAGLKSFRPAQELLLPVLVALIPSAGDREARLSAARGVYERALRLEEAQGRRSATTAHAIGGALLGQERYREAIEPIQAGLELAPRYHGLRSNLGIAYRRLGDLAAAARELRVTLSIRPEDRNAQLTLVRVLLQQDLFAEAELWIGKMAFADESKGQRQHLDLLGEVQYCRALAALDAGDPDGASAAARSALTHFGEGSQRVEALICQAIVAGDFRQAFAQIALVLQGEPTNWAHLRILLRAMPADLSDSQSAALRGYLGALIEHLAPARPVSETPARDSQ